MGIVEISGGQMSYASLTNKLEDKLYAVLKMNIWLKMLNQGMLPKRWLKANTKGTKVNFHTIKEASEYEKGLIDLQVFVDETNQKFGLNIKLKRSEE